MSPQDLHGRALEVELEQTATTSQSQRRPHRPQPIVQGRAHSLCLEVTMCLQLLSLLFHVLQRSVARRHGDGMLAECSCEKCHSRFGHGLVAVCPISTVNTIHEFCLSGHYPDRESSCTSLPVGRQIRTNIPILLGTSLMQPEPCYYLVEHQHNIVLFGDLPQCLQENAGMQIRPPTLNGLNQHRSNGTCVPSDPFQRLHTIVRQLHCVLVQDPRS
mmetsp:Transcript_77362/g.129841  ORF Transcript_77362/g.129841 Transcript_77362/m.129841 type:complete len:216 (+) Transcript_77362:296-943(+)